MKHVAHVCSFEKNGRPMIAWDKAKDIKLGDRLYAAPKQWVGLTDEEVSDVIDNILEGGGWLDVARAIELALKEKNI